MNGVNPLENSSTGNANIPVPNIVATVKKNAWMKAEHPRGQFIIYINCYYYIFAENYYNKVILLGTDNIRQTSFFFFVVVVEYKYVHFLLLFPH